MKLKVLKCWMVGSLLLGGGGSVFATLPLNTDEADTQDPGTFQVEAGTSYEKSSECRHFDVPVALTYGVMPKVDVAVGFGGQFENRCLDDGTREKVRGCDDLNLGMKWMFIEESTYIPRQTLNPSVKFPTADDSKGLGNGKTDYDLTWKASKSIGEKTGVHVNVGYLWNGNSPDDGDIFHYGAAVDYQLLEKVQWVGEVFGEEELKEHETDWQYNTGFRYEVLDNLKLVASAGSRISGNAPDLTATVGVIWVLGNKKTDK